MANSPQEVIEFASRSGVKVVDMRFCDLLGTWHHFSLPVSDLSPEVFSVGMGFDGSSIRGFQSIDSSDLMLLPDPESAIVDTMLETPTLSLICDIHDPVDGIPYGKDPRGVARRAEEYLRSTGIADTSYWGPEAEFFIFNSVRYDNAANASFYEVDSNEGAWNTGAEKDLFGEPNLGHLPRHKGGYFPAPPVDHYQDLRTQMMLALGEMGVEVEVHHHEVGTAGQAEIDIRRGTLLKTADAMMTYKYVVKNVAAAAGCSVTFMPKPIFGDNGSGMHCHQSLWNGEEPIFFDETGSYNSLSETAINYIGGILKHAPALLAFCAPTTNSYKRLVPGFEAPVSLVYSARNRSAAIRIPMYNNLPSHKRIEFRCPDPAANPYLAFSAMLMAGLDGVQNKIVPPDPVDEDIYELVGKGQTFASTPGSLDEALNALEQDHAFLTEGGVFSQDLIDSWLDWKRNEETVPNSMRPTPYEFQLYYDA